MKYTHSQIKAINTIITFNHGKVTMGKLGDAIITSTEKELTEVITITRRGRETRSLYKDGNCILTEHI